MSKNIDRSYEDLRNGWKSDRLAQAYVVVGAVRDEGRALTERALQLILCQNEDAPCGVCPICQQVRSHGHPDVLWVEPQKRSRMIAIEQIRDVRSRISQTAFAGGWKACVIVAADRLGQQAANAFLKTLEEPPARSVFFLLTDSPQFLLSTISSRCQTIILSTREPRMEDGRETEMAEILTDSRVEGGVAAFGKAHRLERILKAFKDEAEEAVREGDESDEDSNEQEKEVLSARINALFREKRTCLMRSLLFWYRDILLLAAGGDDTLLYFGAYREYLHGHAAKIGPAYALNNVRIVEEMNRQLEQNLTDGTVLSFGFSKLR